MTTHCMLDIETLDTAPSAAVLSIGAVLFHMHDQEIIDTFYTSILVADQVAVGRTRSEDTLRWWSQQSDSARACALEVAGKVRPQEALDALTEFMGSGHGIDQVWGNGANFDNVIVADLYRSYRRDAPWKFWQDRCFRTVRAMLDPGKHLVPRFAGVPHHALHDALHQTTYLQAIARANPTVAF